jgi:hypothetical protein
MSRPLLTLVRSQILFREVNERLRETVGSFEGPLEFLCECSAEDCVATVSLDLSDYERVRAHPNLFLVVTGHEVLEVDRVVDQGDGYVLVEKIVAADEVIRADPRRRSSQ